MNLKNVMVHPLNRTSVRTHGSGSRNNDTVHSVDLFTEDDEFNHCMQIPTLQLKWAKQVNAQLIWSLNQLKNLNSWKKLNSVDISLNLEGQIKNCQ